MDGAGNPCLIPPGAAAERSESWLPVRTLLERLKDPSLLPAPVEQTADPGLHPVARPLAGLGILDNTFAARLPQAVQEAAVPNLAVLCATSPGETSWVSRRIVRLRVRTLPESGLAGEANGELPGLNAGRAECRCTNCTPTLKNRVNAWAQQHRGAEPTADAAARRAPDFGLAGLEAAAICGRFGRTLERIAGERGFPTADGHRSTSGSGMTICWPPRPYRADPLAWHQFQHRLLWLEQAAAAGEAYASPARSLLNQLKRYASGDQPPSSAAQAPVRNVYDATLAKSLGVIDDSTSAKLAGTAHAA